jgi:phage-related protein
MEAIVIAILYKANETNFTHLGLGMLHDAIQIFVTEAQWRF